MRFLAPCIFGSMFMGTKEFALAEQTTQLRGNLKQQNPCLVLIETHQLENQESQEYVVCELDELDVTSSKGTSYGKRIVKIKGIPSEDLVAKIKNGEIISGETSMMAQDSELTEDSIVISKDKPPRFEKKNGSGEGRKLTSAIGKKRVLVVRVKALDASTTQSKATLSDEIFGTGGDSFNLKTGYEHCSRQQFLIEPSNDPRVTDLNQRSTEAGVFEVTIPNNVVGVANGFIRDAVRSALDTQLGSDWKTSFDLTMLCLPPGTNGSWVANAYVNHYLSVYNDKWCSYPSSGMHEIGHNINLAHSGEGSAEYADQTGMMGYSYSSDDGPEMCFNGAKLWQLGWYNKHSYELIPLAEKIWQGDLVGIDEYGELPGQFVVIKLETDPGALNSPSNIDYFIQFNRASGINRGTKEGANQVLVTTQGDTFSKSLLVAKLSQGDNFVIEDFASTGTTLTISVNSISLSETPSLASLTITYDVVCEGQTECDDGNICNGKEECVDGKCILGSTFTCDDGVSCNGLETCNPAIGCVSGESLCNDSNACNGIEICDITQDKCISGTPIICDNGLFCDGQEKCNSETGKCEPGVPVMCDDGDHCNGDEICSEFKKGCIMGGIARPVACCGDLICNGLENCVTCPQDCVKGSITKAKCGNGICEDGEDCLLCSTDCHGNLIGDDSEKFCCGGGHSGSTTSPYGKTCSHIKCGAVEGKCSFDLESEKAFCCGDGVCEGKETASSCAIDGCLPI